MRRASGLQVEVALVGFWPRPVSFKEKGAASNSLAAQFNPKPFET